MDDVTKKNILDSIIGEFDERRQAFVDAKMKESRELTEKIADCCDDAQSVVVVIACLRLVVVAINEEEATQAALLTKLVQETAEKAIQISKAKAATNDDPKH